MRYSVVPGTQEDVSEPRGGFVSALKLVLAPDASKLWVGLVVAGPQPQNLGVHARVDAHVDDRHRHADIEPVGHAIVSKKGGCLRLDRRAQRAEEQVSLERRGRGSLRSTARTGAGQQSLC